MIGGGIVGLATAYRILERQPRVRLRLIEKETGVGLHQSSHNSGVLHAGLYYKPGSLKARLAVEGIRSMKTFCGENGIAHEVCGKVVIATEPEELPRLGELLERGTANGLQGLKRLSPGEIREIEPHATGLAGIRVPEEGIADYPAVCAALAAKIRAAGGEVALNAEATKLSRRGGSWIAATTAGDFEAELLINCAGLHSDRVASLDGTPREVRIVPFRGEYYELRPERQHLVKHLIYPVPDPKFPFLGVHFTRMIRGGVECGPNAVLAFAREGYRKTDFRVRDLLDAVTYRGLWNFLRRYPRMCFDELRRSFSRELFCASLQRLVPEIQPEDLRPGASGVRAQAMSPSGDLVQDFHIVQREGAFHVVNAPSPGATASLAIGRHLAELALP